MRFFDWLSNLGGPKPLHRMTSRELRREELLMEKEIGRLLRKIEQAAQKKKSLFEKGAYEKTPEVRRMIAQQFEVLTTEQLMLGRQLNLRSKEQITVSRFRFIRENQERGRGNRVGGLITTKDMTVLARLIESDTVSAEVYQQKLDDILAVGRQVDEGEKSLSEGGQTVMDIWEHMDSGLIADRDEGFDEADRRVREEQSVPEIS